MRLRTIPNENLSREVHLDDIFGEDVKRRRKLRHFITRSEPRSGDCGGEDHHAESAGLESGWLLIMLVICMMALSGAAKRRQLRRQFAAYFLDAEESSDDLPPVQLA